MSALVFFFLISSQNGMEKSKPIKTKHFLVNHSLMNRF